MFDQKLASPISWIQLVLTGILFCVWSIPHTNAVRHIVLLILLLTVLVQPNLSPKMIFQQNRFLGYIIAITTLWLLLNVTVVTPDVKESVAGFIGLWLKNLLILWLGIQLGIEATRRALPLKYLLLIMASGLLLLIGHNLLSVLQFWWQTRAFTVFPEPIVLSSKVQMSYIINIFLAMLIIDCASRIEKKQRIFPIATPLLLVFIFLTLVAMYSTGARNGIIGSVLLLLSTSLLLIFHLHQFIDKRYTALLFILIAAGAIGLSYANYKADARWQKIKETIPYALDIDQHRAWVDKRVPLPQTSQGEVDDSAYSRIAYIRAGFNFMQRYPLGVGLRKTAFTRAQELTYGMKNKHAHSGLIEWGVGAGIPGLILFFIFTGWFFMRAFQRYWHQKDMYGLLLLLTISGFWSRMVIENITRDHMFEMFFFMLGVYAALAKIIKPCDQKIVVTAS